MRKVIHVQVNKEAARQEADQVIGKLKAATISYRKTRPGLKLLTY